MSETVNVTINDTQIETAPGRLLIDVAEEHGIFVPRFCYHPGLESVAACRMCMVQIEGSRKPLDPACATPITDGMVVKTNSKGAVEAQESVLELLLINHPLDCPICDRGGECPLQDQTLKFGPGSSRYTEPKRHFTKALPISELVVLDRERCVLCWRCVRFCDEVSGDSFIDLMDRGSDTQINTGTDKPFDSYFSGNTIQICPVGALTSSSYRFLSRPWDLDSTETTCSYCSVGCAISLEHRDGAVMRTQALPNEMVNGFWNCDKGRFGHRYVSHPDRLKAPHIRKDGRLAETGWDEALEAIVHELKSAISAGGPQSVGLIGGSHLLNEDLFAASKFFRKVVGTSNLDSRTFDAAFSYDLMATDGVVGSTAAIADLDSANTILWAGPDPKEELPVLYLRIRAAVEKGAKLVVLHPRRISLSELGTHLRVPPGFEAEAVSALLTSGGDAGDATDSLNKARRALTAERLVICVGQQFVGLSMDRALWALRRLLASRPGAKLLLMSPNANSQGAMDMGINPWSEPGHRPAAPGLGAAQILSGAANGALKFLWIMGADLLSDFPDRTLAENACNSGAFVVASDLFLTPTARAASIVLPAQSFAEKSGSFTNFERRIQPVRAAVDPPGVARSDWKIFDDLAARMGVGFGFDTADDVWTAIAREAPTHSGLALPSLNASAPPRRAAAREPGWPLSWELRAVDAEKREGQVWKGVGEVPTSSSDLPAATQVPTGARGVAAPQRDDSGAPEAANPRNQTGYPLILLAARALYDGGVMATHSPELRNVTPAPYVELNPAEAIARGLNAGAEVTVMNVRGSVRLQLRVSADTPQGAAFVLFDQPGAGANVLMDATEPATYVEIAS